MKAKLFILITSTLMATSAFAANTSTELAKKKGEVEVRNIVDQSLTKYCSEQCKLIGIDMEADIAAGDEVAPGFEDSPSGGLTLSPAGGTVHLLMDDALGPVSRKNILNFIKKELSGLPYPVQLQPEFTKFPEPATSAYKVAELRDRIARTLKENIISVLNQYCPEACTLGDFDVEADSVNAEEVQYGSSSEYIQDGGTAIHVRNAHATILMDEGLPADEMTSLVEMIKLKTNYLKNVDISQKVLKFPRPTITARRSLQDLPVGPMSASEKEKIEKSLHDFKESLDSKSTANNSTTTNQDEKHTQNSESKLTQNQKTNENISTNTKENRSENYSRIEKIERVESGDAVQQVLEKFKYYGIIFSAIILALLMTLVALGFRKQGGIHLPSIFDSGRKESKEKEGSYSSDSSSLTKDERATLIAMRAEAAALHDELMKIFSEHPKIAKHVFAQVLTEEGVDITAQYIELFGETVVLDLLKDPTLQSDLSELMDFYARNTFDMNEEEKLLLLRKLHHRTTAAKMAVHGSRSAALFDFLFEMDSPQIQEMIRNESNTVKAIVLTQLDSKKRQALFGNYSDDERMHLMTELTRIDHLPKNYIFNVAAALKRKKSENPRLNTEALPGTDVLVAFLEKANMDVQRGVIQQLINASGDVLQNVKAKLVSLDTLRFLKDSQLVEVITGMKHDELLQFLKGCNNDIRNAVLSKAPQDLAIELREEIQLSEPVNKETYNTVERKVLNRIKVLSNQGMVNLSEVNERMFAQEFGFAKQTPPEVTHADISRRIA